MGPEKNPLTIVNTLVLYHGAVASFKQRGEEKIKALVGNQKAMNHNQECT